jgi:hypothetical protein
MTELELVEVMEELRHLIPPCALEKYNLICKKVIQTARYRAPEMAFLNWTKFYNYVNYLKHAHDCENCPGDWTEFQIALSSFETD